MTDENAAKYFFPGEEEKHEVVIVPVYGDVNDRLALDIIAGLYPSREIVGINCMNLVRFGGALHCVTQQQPALNGSDIYAQKIFV